MNEFLIYFLDHMPTADQWMAFLFVNLFAYMAARNTVLRRQQRVLADLIHQMEIEGRLKLTLIDELDQRTNEYWVMIQKQANQLEELINQLNSAKASPINQSDLKMDSDDYKQFIRQLAYEWAKVELPGVTFLYADYIRIIGQLLTATQRVDTAGHIVRGILQQAVELGKNSAWVEREIRFEELALVTDRMELIRHQLTCSRPVDDLALDAYNERVNRFQSSLKLE
ncbi:hypothetical protein [Spirosoma pulveris]